MSSFLADVDIKQFEGKHNFLAESLLSPNMNKCDCNRLQMFNAHIAQCIQLEDPQPPLVFTRFENQVGKYSSGYKRLKGNWKVIKKIHKNKYNYVMIVQNLDTEEYDIVFRQEAQWLTEHYGCKINNYAIDKLQEEDEINNKILYKDRNYDRNMNFQYGTNLNACFICYKGLTNEDAIVISETTAKRMSSYFVNKVQIPVNTNDILINYMGSKKFYKCFPDIGEEVKGGKVAIERRINYDNIITDLKDLQEIRDNDTVFYSEGTVIDINIYCNSDYTVMENQEYNKQVYAYIMKQRRYYEEFVDFLNPIIEGKKTSNYSTELLYYYNRYKALLNNEKFNYQGKKFDNYIIEFTILEELPVSVGSKISGRYGKIINVN